MLILNQYLMNKIKSMLGDPKPIPWNEAYEKMYGITFFISWTLLHKRELKFFAVLALTSVKLSSYLSKVPLKPFCAHHNPEFGSIWHWDLSGKSLHPSYTASDNTTEVSVNRFCVCACVCVIFCCAHLIFLLKHHD